MPKKRFSTFDPGFTSLKKIWDYAEHNGMTDLIEYQGALFCCFREGMGHKGDVGNGSIRILRSGNGKEWVSVECLSRRGFDLRDPHFSIMPDGRMMLTLGGSIYEDEEYEGCYPHVAFSSDGLHWTEVLQLALPEEWIWRVTWHAGIGYGFSYRLSQPKVREKRWILTLFKTQDGIVYEPVKEFRISGYPSEATIRFTEQGEAIALLRRRRNAWIGTSFPPYIDWKWANCGYCIGGPNFIILPDGSMWAGGRDYQKNADDAEGYTLGHTAIGPMTRTQYTPLLFLPSSGDNSYPGLLYKDGRLYVSYYSSHEGKPSIYFAQIIVQTQLAPYRLVR